MSQGQRLSHCVSPHAFLAEEKFIPCSYNVTQALMETVILYFRCLVFFLIAVVKMSVEELHQLNSQLLLQIQGKV